jgi:hypothetical protein
MILGWRDWLQMRWVNTACVAAEVIEMQSSGNWSN